MNGEHLAVTPESFKGVFASTASRLGLGQRVRENWAWNHPEGQRSDCLPRPSALSNGDLTHFVNAKVVPELAARFGLVPTFEYPLHPFGRTPRLDVLLCDCSDPNTPLPVIAWEHENIIHGTHSRELRNLLAFPGRLRVLVTYRNSPDRKNGTKWLEKYRSVCVGARGVRACGHALLIVFGMPDGRWEFHKYDEAACVFVQLV
ncbi:hypothetical protein JXD38_06725 [candidate division WOR-3 bacterium]|nr:hypothetical protein [candidate division WOR-3 bacterium]